jgi:hypothetical protein
VSDHTLNRAGYEQAGDQQGAGSGLHVVRALAVGGQVVRVVFSAEPKHRSASAIDDGRNPANYAVTITAGTGQTLQVVGVQPAVIAWPAYGLWSDSEFALDIQTDRPMVVGLQYLVTVKTPLVSMLGEAVGSPYAAPFIGAARPVRTRQIRRKTGLVDFASDPFTGGIMVDKSGDWATHEGTAGTRKRIWRIALTAKGSFAFLPNFGLGYDIKKPATLSILTSLRTDLRQQISQQPDVKSSSTAVLMDSRGLLDLTIKAQTTAGQDISDTVKATADGGILIP